MMDTALLGLMFDQVTIEPFTGMDVNQAQTYGAAVTYTAQVLPYTQRVIDKTGKEIISSAHVIIPERVAVDSRSRLTLPAGFVPLQPPIITVRPVKGLGIDHTEIVLA